MHAGPAAGTVEVITKPGLGTRGYLKEKDAAIAQVVQSAAKVRMEWVRSTGHVVATGNSAGGSRPLEAVLTALVRIATGEGRAMIARADACYVQAGTGWSIATVRRSMSSFGRLPILCGVAP